ncbi:MAG: DUF899 domain-containing protein [Actinomycetota bacterium]
MTVNDQTNSDASTAVNVVDRDAWHVARLAHLEEEKAFTRQRDELSRKRRSLPWLEITEDYRFAGPAGEVGLLDLFDGRGQLLVYHFMMGPDWEEGCPSCSFWADNYNGTEAHLAARDTALVAVARTSVDNIARYQARMGWTFPWYSSLGSSFNYDMGVSFTDEQMASGEKSYNYGTLAAFGEESPGISIFARGQGTDDRDRVFLTYQTFSRGLDMLNGAYHMLDLTPKGRDEQDLPWGMAWLRRHDQYED